MTNPQRDVWMPYYDSTEATAFGEDWPVWIVARWERNAIGETRFTGETRVYAPRVVDVVKTDALDKASWVDGYRMACARLDPPAPPSGQIELLFDQTYGKSE